MTEAVASPCVGICRMDDATGWCTGCLRTLDEIAAWSLLSEADKLAVCSRLGGRRAAWRLVEHGAPQMPGGVP